MAGETPVLVHNCSPKVGPGASLDNISAADAAKIQAAADKVGKPVSLVGSRASGNAHGESDWDYVVTAANSKIKDKIKWLAPSGMRTGQGKGMDIFVGGLNEDLPYITFFLKGLCDSDLQIRRVAVVLARGREPVVPGRDEGAVDDGDLVDTTSMYRRQGEQWAEGVDDPVRRRV